MRRLMRIWLLLIDICKERILNNLYNLEWDNIYKIYGLKKINLELLMRIRLSIV